jgi:hypothetical protein
VAFVSEAAIAVADLPAMLTVPAGFQPYRRYREGALNLGFPAALRPGARTADAVFYYGSFNPTAISRLTGLNRSPTFSIATKKT